MNVYTINPHKLIEKAAEELKKEIKMPEWAKFVKTSTAKERPPVNLDWWYMRAASLLRKLYLNSPIGVNRLKKFYGGKKNRGHKPERVYKGSGKIIRVILQQLEKLGFVNKEEKLKYKGRKITPKGKKFLDGLAKVLK